MRLLLSLPHTGLRFGAVDARYHLAGLHGVAFAQLQLLEFARGPDSDAFDRAIDVQISRLRRKLDDGGGGQDLIRTIRNEGYMFTAKVKRT